ncbi:hypothetical protein [Natronorubrum sp. FCH18a]|uniref:hypothetical protein n=1 Tax=Natronorubrum sp. FCH18a TaxID=3447018 RepID=UPI003F51A14E
MATDNSTSSDRSDRPSSGIVRNVARLVGDLLIVTCWVVFLTLIFLGTSWPQWSFYLLLLLGIGLYVALTATWTGSSE